MLPLCALLLLSQLIFLFIFCAWPWLAFCIGSLILLRLVCLALACIRYLILLRLVPHPTPDYLLPIKPDPDPERTTAFHQSQSFLRMRASLLQNSLRRAASSLSRAPVKLKTHLIPAAASTTSHRFLSSTPYDQDALHYNAVRKGDMGEFQEYSVIFTNRALNLMSKPFQQVMRDLNVLLKTTYNAEKVAIMPG